MVFSHEPSNVDSNSWNVGSSSSNSRATVFLNEKWYLPLYDDIGTGDSDLTWQLGAGIGYRFDKLNVPNSTS